MHRFFYALVLFFSTASAQNTPGSKVSIENILREASVQNALSDRFGALRIMSFLREKKPAVFLKSGTGPYLEALEHLTSNNSFSAECNKLSKVKNAKARNAILYTCGRLLFEDYSLKRAQDFLEKVSLNSQEYVPAQIILSTIYLSYSDGERCIRTLTPKMARLIKNQQTKDMYHLTRARCFVEINQTGKAIVEYQFIATTSPYYFDGLEETTFAQFKSRHLESARTLLDVMITSYESGFGDGSKGVSTSTYFRSRYLQAYIELLSKNKKRTESLFNSLRDAIVKFEKESSFSDEQAAQLANLIANDNLQWIDMKAMPQEIHRFLNLARDWGDIRFRKRLERLIDYQFSLSREINRMREQPRAEFDSYLRNLQALDQKNKNLLVSEFIKAARTISRSIKVMKIKADLGRIEIIWSDRAEGMRGIGELLESYQQEVDDVEDFLGQ